MQKVKAVVLLGIVLVLTLAPRLSVGQSQKVIYFYLTPSVSVESMDKSANFIKDFLEKETGLTIKLGVPPSYENLVDKFGNPEPCFSIMSSQSYVLAHQKHGALVKLRSLRYGASVYYGQIICRAGSGIKTIKDIQGKSMAYTDELSTSGYLYPKQILDKNSITPSKIVFAKKHDEVVRMVYEGKVDAGAAFYSPPGPNGELHDARGRIKDQYPDVEKKVITLVKTDPIPNDPIVFSKAFDADTARKLYVALVKLSTEQKGKEVLRELYGSEGFVKASDTDYNSLRQVMGVVAR
ncbi:phosphate/phosphite/phosphonate ABC transporter substrate-binding protein [Chryseolinea lacunae]|uniref:Phosphate/phosphite/phosphonate ABC transporter substrate-binding protein n=1 Tax=Chryseolinea lacunae TaxID=2801331 RepID=A0ABS1KU07_9BACT|nr:phosphate/phosphite/phosphonate ABC transporter substrate-binding protein [Chryseolinea lacunae]MBL0742678.1 phosphate/phosphite/phosphonate ABC transporter substrate-binding protein [Chryseolinea lacunae]